MKNVVSIVILSISFSASMLFGSNCTENLQIIEIMKERHSGKSYDPSKPITIEQIYKLSRASSFTPSSYNEQPWHFIICDREITPDSYEKLLNSIVESNRKWAKDAPLLILISAKTNYTKGGKPNTFANYDTGAAAMSLSLEAVELGLMVHQLGGFDVNQIKNDFSIPEDFTPICIAVVGYELSNPETVQPKIRKPLHENFFLGEWGAGLPDEEPSAVGR